MNITNNKNKTSPSSYNDKFSIPLPITGELLTVQVFDANPTLFAILEARESDCILHIWDHEAQSTQESFILESIDPQYGSHQEKEFVIAVSFPHIAVSERKGLNAALLNLESKAIRLLRREDYHCDVCTYGIGFIQHEEKKLLLHQTQWNRLDITDLATGELLTRREISHTPPLNYLDYFHSQLHISPNGSSFLSNGWYWAPQDCIRYSTVQAFLERYELSTVNLDYQYGYNWDRPATFIDDETFVIIVNDPDPDMLDEEELAEWPEHQFRLYNLKNQIVNERLQSHLYLKGDSYLKDNYGDIEEPSSLHFSPTYNVLLTISTKGIFVVNLEGQLLKQLKLAEIHRWQFSRTHEMLYSIHDKQLELHYLSDLIGKNPSK